jgi:hypothetical protein
MKRLWELLSVGLFVVLCSVSLSRAQVCDDAQLCTNPDMCSNGQCIGTPVTGPACDDGNECTGPDTCANGVCLGAPISGGSCDDGNPCTTNDTCVSGFCQGTPAPNDTPCGSGGCGACQSGFCAPILAKLGMPCEDAIGPCTENDVCLGAICLGMFKTCPDSDNNKCTIDACNPLNGQCQNFGAIPCGDCKTCDPAVGCVAANEGTGCDDGDPCTSASSCTGGACLAGVGPVGTPTDTPTLGATATETQTAGTPTDTPALSPSATPSETAVQSPTDTPTTGPSATPSNTAAQTPTDTPTGTPAGSATATITPTGTPAGTTATVTATSTPTGTATGTATATITGIATSTATHTPATPINTPTSTVTTIATATATATGMATSTNTVGATATSTGSAISTATATGSPISTATATGSAISTATATGSSISTPTATGSAISTPTATGSPISTATATGPPISTATATATSLPIDATIIVGSTTGAPGSTVTISVSLETTVPVAGTQNDISFDPRAPIAANGSGKPDCSVNQDIDKGGTSFAFEPAGCTVGSTCTSVRALVLALDNICPICGTPTTECPGVLPCPVVIYTCRVAIASDATGTIPLPCSGAQGSSPDGHPVGADCTNGSITVAVPADATITIGTAIGAAGNFVPVDVSLDTDLVVAGTQNVITFPPQAAIAAGSNGKPMCSANPDIDKNGSSFAFQPPGCTVGTSCTSVKALILALDNVCPICGASTTECPGVLPCPVVMYTCTIAIAENAADGTYPLTCSNASASDPIGNPLTTDCIDGSVLVGVQPTPTSTATATTSAPPTATSTPGTPTPPTPTATTVGSVTATATSLLTPTGTAARSATATQTNATPPTATGTPTSGTPPATSTVTATAGTPTPPPPPTRTSTRTKRPLRGGDSDSCQIVDGAASQPAWVLLAPLAALLRLRRRRR